MQKPKLNPKKLYVLILSFVLISSLSAGYIGYTLAQGSGLQTVTISGGVYPGAPSYTIFTDGAGNYYAKNAYGAIEFTSTTWATVTQNAIDALPSGGGSIFLPLGGYTGNINLDHKFVTINADKGSYITGTVTISNFGCVINNLEIDGTLNITSYEFHFNDGTINGVVNLLAYSAPIYQVYFDTSNFISGSVTVDVKNNEYANSIHWLNCYFENSPILLTATGTSTGQAHRTFDKCYFYSSSAIPLTLVSGTDDKLTDSHFDCEGIRPINATNTITSVTVQDCSFNSLTPLDNSNGKMLVVNPQGYKLVNSGLCYTVYNGSDVTHGLGATPTMVYFSVVSYSWGDTTEPILIYWDKVNTNSATFRVVIMWANGTFCPSGVTPEFVWTAEVV